MSILLKTKTVKARKVHHCMDCHAEAVQPGQPYERQTCVYDGRIYDWISCVDCDAIMGAVYSWFCDPDEGVGPHEFQEWAETHRDDPEHGPRARAFLTRMEAAR